MTEEKLKELDAWSARIEAIVAEHDKLPLWGHVALLAPDELAVLTVIAERLVAGQRQYGRLCLADDPRDFLAEELAERLDATVYGACELLRRRRRVDPA